MYTDKYFLKVSRQYAKRLLETSSQEKQGPYQIYEIKVIFELVGPCLEVNNP